jgi:two-component system response regulator AtoC
MTLGTQKKLLRVLQEHEIDRVGGTAPVKVDVRVLAATNKNLREEMLAGRFREDLFYRLDVIAIHLPPLRERSDDIPGLVAHFLDKHRFSPTSPPARISEEALLLLERYSWPGNVRELESTIWRGVLLSQGAVITPQHLIFDDEWARSMVDINQRLRQKVGLEELLREVEREALRVAVRQCEQDTGRAAELLGITPEVLAARWEALGASKGSSGGIGSVSGGMVPASGASSAASGGITAGG